jgi:hypothetical protein
VLTEFSDPYTPYYPGDEYVDCNVFVFNSLFYTFLLKNIDW